MSEVWAWLVHEGDEWNIIAALVPGGSPMPLVTSRHRLIGHLGQLAQHHHRRTGLPVRLAHYREVSP